MLGLLWSIIGLANLWNVCVLTVRRLHDVGISGWWMLLVPFLTTASSSAWWRLSLLFGVVVLASLCLLLPTRPHEIRYEYRRRWRRLLDSSTIPVIVHTVTPHR